MSGSLRQAQGAFEVKVSPVEVSDLGKEAGVGRMTIDKVYSGTLEGVSKGEMLTGITEGTGAMSYVAIERVTGKLEGRSGSFMLTHSATMMKSDPQTAELNITVVRSSGTDDLAGLAGTMKIVIDADRKHRYEFNYSLPE